MSNVLGKRHEKPLNGVTGSSKHKIPQSHETRTAELLEPVPIPVAAPANAPEQVKSISEAFETLIFPSPIIDEIGQTDGRPVVKITFRGEEIRSLLDSGANVCVLSKDLLDVNDLKALEPVNLPLTIADGSPWRVMGLLRESITFGGKRYEVPFFVVSQGHRKILLGYNFWRKAGLKIVTAEGEPCR